MEFRSIIIHNIPVFPIQVIAVKHHGLIQYFSSTPRCRAIASRGYKFQINTISDNPFLPASSIPQLQS
jgi:hypothetical protein